MYFFVQKGALISIINMKSRLLILKKNNPLSMFIEFLDIFHHPLLVYCSYILVFFSKNPTLHFYLFCNFCTTSKFISTSMVIREMRVQSNLAIRNCLIRNRLVLRNHFLWPICQLLYKDKENLALRHNFRATRKFLIPKFDCT